MVRRGTYEVRRNVRVHGAGLIALCLTAGVVAGLTEMSPVGAAGARPNPDLQSSCGVDVTVILDESGSIDSAGAILQTENAVEALANGLAGTGSSARFVEFSTNARDAIIGGSTAPTLVTDAYVSGPLSAYLNSTSPPQNADGFQPTSGNPAIAPNVTETFTNWESGLFRAGTVGPSNFAPIAPLVVFITDGNPNTIGTAGTSTDNDGGGANNAASAALEEIDLLKAAGAHVLGIGVGGASDDASFDRLVELIEPGTAQIWEGVGPLDIGTVDAVRVDDFADLEAALDQVASELCSQSLDITKLDQNGVPLAGRTFTVTAAGLPDGEQQSFSFLDPAGDDGPPNATATTDVGGAAGFQWTPVGQVSAPADWTSTATFTEQLPAGWALPTTPGTCVLNPGGVDVPLSASVDQAGLATFSLGVGPGGPFVFGAGDTVSCTITNNEPGAIRVEKVTEPDTDLAFTFSPAGWNEDATFQLTDGGEFTSGDLAPGGEYAIAETDLPAGWATTDATCTNGTPEAIVVVAGETTTCTFTNEATSDLSVTKTVVAAPVQPVSGGGDAFTVAYSLDVVNRGSAGSTYTLTDTPEFGEGATITSVTATGPGGDVEVTGPVAGVYTLVTDDAIAGASTESYVVTVAFDVAATMAAAERVCDDSTAGRATFNSATVTFPGGSDTDDDCVGIPEPQPLAADLGITKVAFGGHRRSGSSDVVRAGRDQQRSRYGHRRRRQRQRAERAQRHRRRLE